MVSKRKPDSQGSKRFVSIAILSVQGYRKRNQEPPIVPRK